MFLPLRDHNPTRRTAVVTIALIAINAVVFLFEVGQGSRMSMLVFRWGAIPYELTHGVSIDKAALSEDSWMVRGLRAPLVGGQTLPAPVPPILTALTSMFLHGSWAHLIFNMLYLWIFGNNVEDVLGRARYLVFYLAMGFAALTAHVLSAPSSTTPVVGASGAIGGVLGAYMAVFPRARVTSLLFLGIFFRILEVPALLLLGVWFALQLFSGMASLGMESGGGVAYWAHIGGFTTGWLTMKVWKARRGPEVHAAPPPTWNDPRSGPFA